MVQRLLLIAAIALSAGAAQAAPELALRVGMIALNNSDANVFTGYALRFPISDSLRITGEYDTTAFDVTFDISGSTVQIVNYTQFGAYLEYTTGDVHDFWATGRLGYAHNEADSALNGSFDEDRPAVGVEVGYKAVGLGWLHTEVNDIRVDAVSLMFIFRF